MLYRSVARPLLFRMGGGDPEVVHERMLAALALVSRSPALTRALRTLSALGGASVAGERDVFGLRFPNPVGLAAGFDKNGVALPALAALGFGHLEAGTVTWHAQPGNPRPRLYRIPSEGALINRMGFNNAGAAALAARLARMPHPGVPVGVSLGKSKVTPLDDAIPDYVASLEALYSYADYFAINISSPNTPGLRTLHERDRLDALLAALVDRLRTHAGGTAVRPLLVKVSPDLTDDALDDVLEVCLARGVNGLIAVNTTVSRDMLGKQVPAWLRDQPGGLSGTPLRARAVTVVRHLHERTGGRLPVIGCGGVSTPDDARALLDAGAALVQIYTGFIYEGPWLARRLARALA